MTHMDKKRRRCVICRRLSPHKMTLHPWERWMCQACFDQGEKRRRKADDIRVLARHTER